MHEEHGVNVYCDGSCEPNPGRMGIGVYCNAPQIEISREVGSGTNNIAECLAAIAALEEARRLHLTGFTLFSDSMLVCNWVRGVFQCRSSTAQKYVPHIRELASEMKAEMRWCPGHSNPADPLSRRQTEQPSTTNPLTYVITTPMDRLRFRDFARLKVGGRDEYSGIRLPRLKELVPQHAEVEQTVGDDSAVATCLRWMLRGLPLDKAIRKVRTDLEIAENAKGRSRD